MQSRLARMLGERHERLIVAGMEGEHMRAFVEGHGEGALQVGAQGLDLRQQARLGLALGPQQLGAEVGQARGLALLPQDQGLAERGVPALELAPDMPIRQAELARGGRDRTLVADRLQQIEQRIADQRRCSLGAERVVEADPMHFSSY